MEAAQAVALGSLSHKVEDAPFQCQLPDAAQPVRYLDRRGNIARDQLFA